jgi:hypothetical protein
MMTRTQFKHLNSRDVTAVPRYRNLFSRFRGEDN